VAKSEEEAEIQLKHGGYVGSTEAPAASLDELLADAEAQLPPELKEQHDAEAAEEGAEAEKA
jgi:antitoxin component of MazEF toxin-antitoxin module